MVINDEDELKLKEVVRINNFNKSAILVISQVRYDFEN